MSKVRIVPESETRTQYQFMCPGCDQVHALNNTWSFNGDMDKPTFSPSVLVRGYNKSGEFVCHSFVSEGKIQYLGDCTHALANQTVELPEIE